MSEHYVNEIDDITLEVIPDDLDAVLLVLAAKGGRTRVRLTEPLLDKLAAELVRVAAEMEAETVALMRGDQQ